MSLIKKSDVKNHLSPRHRTEIHLQPAIQADSTGFPYEELAGPCGNDSTEDPLGLSGSGGRSAAPIVPPKSVLD